MKLHPWAGDLRISCIMIDLKKPLQCGSLLFTLLLFDFVMHRTEVQASLSLQSSSSLCSAVKSFNETLLQVVIHFPGSTLKLWIEWQWMDVNLSFEEINMFFCPISDVVLSKLKMILLSACADLRNRVPIHPGKTCRMNDMEIER